MKDPADKLSSLFKETFAREEAGFEMADWHKMEALLARRERKRLFGIWLSSGLLFLALGTVVMAFIMVQKEYTPRGSAHQLHPVSWSDLSIDSKDNTSPRPTPVSSTTGSGTSPALKNTMADSPVHTAVEPGQVITGHEEPHFSEQPSTSGEAGQATALPGETLPRTLDSEPAPVTVSAVIPVTGDVKPAEAGEEEEETTAAPVKNTDEIGRMPLLQINPPAPLNLLPQRKGLENPGFKPLWHFYLVGGLNKTVHNSNGFVYPGTGKRGGVGISYQVREHFFLATEVSALIEAFQDTSTYVTETSYGFTGSRHRYKVNTSELFYFEVPFMASYRVKRVYVGGGFALGYLMGVKNEVLTALEYEGSAHAYSQTDGYYRWDRFRSWNGNALADFQYQLSPRAFAGLRGSVGLTNVLATDDRSVRKSRLDVYLKINLR